MGWQRIFIRISFYSDTIYLHQNISNRISELRLRNFFFLGLLYTSPVNAIIDSKFESCDDFGLFLFFIAYQNHQIRSFGMLISLVSVLILLTEFNMQRLLELEFYKRDILIFIANLVFALQNIWVKQYVSNFSNVHFTIFTNVICLICFMLVLPLAVPTASVHHLITTKHTLL